MKVSAICPTYRRPDCIANAVACFLLQDHTESEMIVLDDSGDYIQEVIDQRVHVVSISRRFRSLPEKYNALAGLTSPDSELFVVWEDDDIYLPNHLTQHVEAAQRGGQLITPALVVDEKQSKSGQRAERDNVNCFHCGWSYSAEFFRSVGGYPVTRDLQYDLQMFRKLTEAGARLEQTACVSMVYRWLSTGFVNGSALHRPSPEGLDWWDQAERLPRCQKQSGPVRLQPRLDQQAREILEKQGFDRLLKKNYN